LCVIICVIYDQYGSSV